MVQKEKIKHLEKRSGRYRCLSTRGTGLGWIVAAIWLLVGAGTAGAAEPWKSLDLVLDVKSKFSDGCLSVQNLAELAQHRGIGGLLITDHDRISLEYGLRPFERIFKKKEESPSILSGSASTYLSEIRQVDEEFPNTIIIPGVESSPFYYWTGGLFEDSLKAHNWDKHLLVAGLGTAEAYEQLPTLNSNFSTRYLDKFRVMFLLFCVLGIVALVFFYRRKYPKTSLLLAAIAFLLAANYHPLRSSPFDQYHGDPGPAPFQETIDYVNSQGGLVFWNHLESPKANRVVTEGEMQLETLMHPEDLMLTQNYSGFQALGDNPIPAAEPGNEWDQVLHQHLKKERAAPVWGFGANDFHCEDQDGHRLGAVRTVAWVRQPNADSVFDALKKGRMYAVTQPAEKSRLSLNQFIVADRSLGLEATLGESLVSSDIPELTLAFASTGGAETSVQFKVIRNGAVVKQETVSLPYKGTWRDLEVNPAAPVFYRVMAVADNNARLVSNPIFVKFGDRSQAVAAAPAEPTPKAPAVPQDPVVPALPQLADARVPAVSTPIMENPEVVSPPTGSDMSLPEVASPENPQVAAVPAPTVPEPSVQTPASSEQVAISRINGLSLKKGPGASFPEVMKAAKGERLELVRVTTVVLNGKPWVVVKKEGKLAYAWQGFLEMP